MLIHIEAMRGSIDITADPDRRLLRIVSCGFFSAETVARFERQRGQACRTLGGDPRDHVSIVDVSDCKLQTQEAVAAIASIVRDPRYRARRIAFVTGAKSLARMQLRRMISDANVVQVFDDEAAAEKWLFAPATVAAA